MHIAWFKVSVIYTKKNILVKDFTITGVTQGPQLPLGILLANISSMVEVSWMHNPLARLGASGGV
jgi:hypothetical protein